MNILKKYFTRWQIVGSLFALVLLSQALVPSLLQHANAAALSGVMVRFDRMNASQATTGLVCAKVPATGPTEAGVKVTFPTGYTVSTTVGNWAVATTDIPSGTTAWPSIGAPTGSGDFTVAGQTVGFQSGDLTSNSATYCFRWTNTAALSIKSSASSDNTGTVTTRTSAPADIDTGSYATASLGNNCGSGSQACDQIQVSASVNASFSFSLSATTAALGTLLTSSPTESSAINATVSTNASHGWQMWSADSAGTPGLTSTSASKTISYNPTAGSSPATLSAGSEGFNMGAGTASGTTCTSVTTDTNFASGGTQYRGGGLDNTLRSLAVSTGVANACSLPLRINASISATTPAANDYASTITVVAAGNF